ncbi:MAG: rhodanese-like domain-containing protein [Alloprevotella sp.]
MLCNLLGCTAQSPKFESLDTDDFEKLIADTAVVRLDVRTAEEFAEGHIVNAVNIDVMQEDFEKNATTLLPKDKIIAVYCRSGRRSKKAAEILTDNGFKVKELNGGFTAWSEAGKEFAK